MTPATFSKELEQMAEVLEKERDGIFDGDVSWENIECLRLRLLVTAKRLREVVAPRLKAAEAVCKQVKECDYSYMNHGKGPEERGFHLLCDLADKWRQLTKRRKHGG